MFTLRKWQPSDAKSLALHANNPQIGQNLRDGFPYPYTVEDAQAFIYTAQNEEQQGKIYRAIDVDGAAVGSIGVFPGENVYCRTAEIGYWLGEAYWGLGIASSAVRQLSAEVFATTAIVRLYAGVFERNAASCKVLEKAGYTLEARLRADIFKDGEIMDTLLYALIRQE